MKFSAAQYNNIMNNSSILLFCFKYTLVNTLLHLEGFEFSTDIVVNNTT